jgi:hypothetical protein
MACILTIRGGNLNVEEFVQKTGLEPYKKFDKGEPRIRTKPEGKNTRFLVCPLRQVSEGK